MPSSLDRLVHRATFFSGLNVRLASLVTTRRVVEEQLELGRHLEIARLRQEHAGLGGDLHPDDKEHDLAELEGQVTHHLPKVFRGGYVVLLWSMLERSVKDILVRAADHIGQPVDPTAIRRPPFFKNTAVLFQSTLTAPAFPNAEEKHLLEVLYAVRNVLAHHDGRVLELAHPLTGIDDQGLAALGLAVEHDYDFAYVVPTEEYLAESTKLVVHYVQSTAARVYDTLFP